MTLENDASNGTEENKSKEIPDGKGQNGTDHDSANIIRKNLPSMKMSGLNKKTRTEMMYTLVTCTSKKLKKRKIKMRKSQRNFHSGFFQITPWTTWS